MSTLPSRNLPSKNFINLSYLKITLGIDSAQTNNDTRLQDIVTMANEEMDARLRPYLGESELVVGTEDFVKAQKVAATHARSLWYEFTGQLDRAKHNDTVYEEKLDALQKSITADKPDRRLVTFIEGKDNLEHIYQPFNLQEYITREF